MARDKGTFEFSANFEPRIQAPLDSRMVVGLYSDLLNPITWRDSENLVWLYNGAIVSVASDPNPEKSGIYTCLDI